VAGHVRLELRNVVANYPFESSRGFPGSAPNSGHGDHSRLSCSAGDKQLGASPRPATAAHRRQPHSQPQSWTDRQAAKGAPPARRSAKVLNRARGKALSAPFAHHQLRRTRYTVGSPNRASAHSTAFGLTGNVRGCSWLKVP